MSEAHPSHAQVLRLYERRGADWGALRGSEVRIESTWLGRFMERMPEGGSVLDIGCGTGQPLASALAKSGFRVTGVDGAESMIALCRQAFPSGDWRLADMRGLDLRQRFNGLLAWDSFFHLAPDDQRAMFPTFRRHAAPGAVLLFTSGPKAGEALGAFEGETLYHASLDPTEYRQLLEQEGFEVVAHRAEDPECGMHTVWLAQAL